MPDRSHSRAKIRGTNPRGVSRRLPETFPRVNYSSGVRSSGSKTLKDVATSGAVRGSRPLQHTHDPPKYSVLKRSAFNLGRAKGLPSRPWPSSPQSVIALATAVATIPIPYPSADVLLSTPFLRLLCFFAAIPGLPAYGLITSLPLSSTSSPST